MDSEPNRAKRAFLAHMRHELRTPINAILGYSELLLEEVEERAETGFAPDLKNIGAAGRQLLGLVNAILDQSKIDAQPAIDIVAFEAEVRRRLRTPVTSVIGYTDILIEDAEAAQRDFLVPDLQRIRTAAERLLSLITDILSLWQIQAGKKDLDVAASASFQMVREAVHTVTSLEEKQRLLPATEGGSLLVVDDNETNRDLLLRRLMREGHRVSVAENGRRALEVLKTQSFDLILLDILMPEMNGYEVLTQLKADNKLRDIPVIMLSALDDMDSVVRCIELGAEEYLPKPFSPVLLRARIGSCLEKKRQRERELAYLEQLRIERERSLGELLGELSQGPAIIPGTTRLARDLRSAAESMAKNDRPLLLLGEPGTEKKTVAQMVHQKSARANAPFLCLDCANIPTAAQERNARSDGMLEELGQLSALFGHQSGAFSFARTNRAGYIELGDGGTLLLENIDRLASPVQEKLLSYFKTGKVCRLGSSQEVRSDVRIIATCRIPLAEAVLRSSFNAELEKCLAGQTIIVPPLRERKRDLMAWVEHFVQNYSSRLDKNVQGVSKEAMNLVLAYDWPNNVEELDSVIQRGVRLADSQALTPEQIFIGLAPIESGKKPDLLRLPFLRRALESPLYPTGLQMASVMVFGLVLLSGTLGPQEADRNAALPLVWALFWPFMILSIPFAGRLFCSICPIGATGRLIQGRWSLRLKVPTLIRKYGLYGAIVGFVAIFWFEAVTGIEQSPRTTAFLLLAILSCSVAASIIFERAAWCRFMCPLGRMVGTYAALSAVELRTNPAVCKAECKTHGCYSGTERATGCPMYEGAFALQSNEACKFCGDCVKNCTNKAIRLNLRLPGSELWTLPQHNRVLAMFVPVLMGTVLSLQLRGSEWYQNWLGGTGPEWLTYLGLIVVVSFVLLGAMALATMLMRERLERGLTWAPYAFLPLALAGGISERVEPFLTEAGSVLPTFARQIGVGDGGALYWTAASAAAGVQLTFLVLGTLASLYVCHRLMKRYLGSRGRWPRVPLFSLLALMGFSYVLLFILG